MERNLLAMSGGDAGGSEEADEIDEQPKQRSLRKAG